MDMIMRALLPCLAIVIAADTVPLASPTERGFAHNVVYVARSLFTTAIFTQPLMNECASYVSQLSLSFREQSIMALVVATLTAVGSFAAASATAFPMPFGIALFSTPWLALFMASLWLMRGRVIRENEHVRLELQNFSFIGGTQIAMTVIYQAFYARFSRMLASSQTKAVLVLPTLKLLQKNVINRRMKHRDDMKPIVVMLNVEFFHTMFVSCCMQRTTPIHTSAVFIGVDFLHMCVSLYDLHCMIGAIEALARDSEHGFEIEEVTDAALRIDAELQLSRKRSTTSQ